MFEWVKGNVYSMILTFYPNNITLNSSAASNFQDVRWVMIGIDKTNYKLGICPVTKRELDLNLVPLSQLHKISVGNGYARISNKMIIEELSAMIDQSINGLKINAVFDESKNMLVADLHELAASKG